MEFLEEVILDALKDSALLLPFLYLTYLLLEVLEHKAGPRSEQVISRAGHFAPVVGGLLGAVPQCGFSAAAAGLYAGNVISVGTLIAVFLSTSDEAVAVMLSSAVKGGGSNVLKLLTVLGIKVVCGIVVGVAVDLIIRKRRTPSADGIGDICEHEHCHCEKHGIFVSALLHSLQIFAFILAVTLVLNAVIFFVGEENIGLVFRNIPVVGELIAGLVGLIPNCASSVVITSLYLDGLITAGQLLAGLFTGAGVGMLVLFRSNRNIKENLLILLTVFLTGSALGMLFEYTGFAALLGL